MKQNVQNKQLLLFKQKKAIVFFFLKKKELKSITKTEKKNTIQLLACWPLELYEVI